jgi:uncharacterized protein (DUF1778 family)
MVVMSVATTEPKKPLGVRVTLEQHRIITEAAKTEHRSVSSFVLNAALNAALKAAESAPRPRRSQAEIDEIILRAQEAMRRANPTGRSIVDELTAERRAAAALE